MPDQVTVLLGAPQERVRAWYQLLVADERFRVLSYASDGGDLAGKLDSGPDVLILDATLFDGPNVLVSLLRTTAAAYVLLPLEASDEDAEAVTEIPAVRHTWQGDVDLGAELDAIHADAIAAIAAREELGQGAQETPPHQVQSQPPVSSPTPSPPPPPRPHQQGPGGPGGPGRIIAFWSERGCDVCLMALSGPDVCAYLHLPRVPNATVFFETGSLRQAEQEVTWDRDATMQVMLAPGQANGAVAQEQIGTLVEAARAHELVILDLPAEVPGGNAWTMEPLAHAADLVLVMPPTRAGVAGLVAALVTLRDLAAPGRVHVVLNRRAPSGLLSRAKFIEGVADIWGSCPEVLADVDFAPGLAEAMAQGELPGDKALAEALDALAQVAGVVEAQESPVRERRESGRRDAEPGRGMHLGPITVRVGE
jgi:hypothetical protein